MKKKLSHVNSLDEIVDVASASIASTGSGAIDDSGDIGSGDAGSGNSPTPQIESGSITIEHTTTFATNCTVTAEYHFSWDEGSITTVPPSRIGVRVGSVTSHLFGEVMSCGSPTPSNCSWQQGYHVYLDIMVGYTIPLRDDEGKIQKDEQGNILTEMKHHTERWDVDLSSTVKFKEN